MRGLTRRPFLQRRWYSHTRQRVGWRASVITGNTSDTSPVVALNFGDACYVFNPGENTQRALITTNDFPYERAKHLAVFLTQTSLRRCAGLGAIAMDRGFAFDTLKIVGPPGVMHYIAAMRSWRNSVSPHAEVTETSLIPNLDPVPCFLDENLALYGIPLLPDTGVDDSSPENTMAGPLPSLGEAHELRMAMVDSIFRKKPASKLENLPGDDRIQLPRLHQRVRPTMAYIAVCAEHGRNPMILMVLDVPSPSFIPSLRNSFSHSPFYSDLLFKESPDGTVHSIFHLCGQDVLEDDRYLALMGKLPSTANHVISSPHYDCDSPTFEASAIHQLRMNRLDADMFPVPHSSPEPLKRLSDIPNLPLHSFPLEQGLDVYLQPDARPVRKDPSPSAASCLDRNLSPSILRTFGALKHKVMRQDARLQLREKQKLRPAAARERYRRLDDTAIIPLGAFGTHPSFSRNNPSILVRIPHRGSILLEACEGTLGQLIRTYGKSGADEILRDLRCIFVGENCAVNHGGLALLLARRWQLDPPAPNPVYLVAEYDVHLSLREISDIEDLGIDAAAGSGVLPILIDVIDSSLRMANKSRDTYEWAGTARSWTARKSLCTELGLLSFQAVRAPAPHSSYGLVFQHKDGWRIVYSGRNGLTRNLPETPAKTSTVLIHSVDALTESDTPDSLRHAVRELITKYQRIKPDHLLLTSFSGQFDRMALSNLFIRTRRNAKPLVSFAFDNARLTFGTMWRMNMYLPVLDQIWRQDGDEVDDASQSAQDRDA